jgi:hypothetical protein
MVMKILFYDIEVAPIIGTVWGQYEQNLIWNVQDWYMLCFAYKWGDGKIKVVSQTDFPGYKPGSADDTKVLKVLHDLFDEADVVVAHNGDRFDQKKSNARFILNGMPPPIPYQSVDTLKVARKYFAFTSNRLDDLGEYLKVGKKIKTEKELWRGCMAGDPASWRKMQRYNKQDVNLLEKVYLKMLPWDTGHPNRATIDGRPDSCPRCGKVGFMWAQGFRITKTAKYRRWQCKSCGSFVSNRKGEKGVAPDYV